MACQIEVIETFLVIPSSLESGKRLSGQIRAGFLRRTKSWHNHRASGLGGLRGDNEADEVHGLLLKDKVRFRIGSSTG